MRRAALTIAAFALISSVVFFASLPADEPLFLGDEKAGAPVLLDHFYQDRKEILPWFESGHPSPVVKDLLNALKQADREGLRPQDYHLLAINELLGFFETADAAGHPNEANLLDKLLTDAFLTYGTDLVSGHTNPYDVDDDWFAGRRTGDLPTTLERALKKGEIREELNALLPTNPMYQRMRNALARYRQMQKNGGWPKISDGPTLKKGDRDSRVMVLRQRLAFEGDLNQRPNTKPVFDSAMEHALIRFQLRNGLEPDGVMGKDTFATLNIPVEDRVDQIRVNMERCRWLPDVLGRKYIFVNVPSFTLQIIEDNRETMAMRVVVGRKMRQTPVFSSTMTHVIFNPPWSVPIMVARMDILDHIRQEPDYLAKHNFEVYDGYDEGASQVDPSKIEWSSVTPQNLTYRFRQKSGPTNALGRIKFLLPNRFDVYLHDTPSHDLFAKTVRDFSSGCIRVEKPVELATYLLKGDARWTTQKIEAAINKGVEQTVALPEPMPVHLMYWTAFVDEHDNVQFRPDIYGRDPSLNEALKRTSS